MGLPQATTPNLSHRLWTYSDSWDLNGQVAGHPLVLRVHLTAAGFRTSGVSTVSSYASNSGKETQHLIRLQGNFSTRIRNQGQESGGHAEAFLFSYSDVAFSLGWVQKMLFSWKVLDRVFEFHYSENTGREVLFCTFPPHHPPFKDRHFNMYYLKLTKLN